MFGPVPRSVGPTGKLVLAVQLVAVRTLQVALGSRPDRRPVLGSRVFLLLLVVFFELVFVILVVVRGGRGRRLPVRAQQIAPANRVQVRARDLRLSVPQAQSSLAIQGLEPLLGH